VTRELTPSAPSQARQAIKLRSIYEAMLTASGGRREALRDFERALREAADDDATLRALSEAFRLSSESRE
jgi:hypothetical protein